MCGSAFNGYGLIAGLVSAAAILVMAYAEKHGGAHADAHRAIIPHAVTAVLPGGVELRFENAHLDIDLRV
jgi:hypothetical protein